MRKTKEVLENLRQFNNQEQPMLAVFQVGSGRFKDSKGRFTTPPRFIGRVEKVINYDAFWTVKVDIISQVGGSRKPVNSPKIVGLNYVAGHQLVDIYRAGHFYSPRRAE